MQVSSHTRFDVPHTPCTVPRLAHIALLLSLPRVVHSVPDSPKWRLLSRVLGSSVTRLWQYDSRLRATFDTSQHTGSSSPTSAQYCTMRRAERRSITERTAT